MKSDTAARSFGRMTLSAMEIPLQAATRLWI